MSGPLSPRRSLSLLELIVVLAIIAILIALIVPALQSIRAAAAQAQCNNNLRQIGLACHAAHDLHKRMPPAFGFYPESNLYTGTNGLGNIFFHLLPHLEQGALYEQSRTRPNSNPQRDFFFYTANKVHQTPVAIFNCPSDPTLKPGVDPVTNYAPSSYAANYLVFGNVDAQFANKNAQGKPRLAVTFPDGTSNTILFGEKYASAWISAKANQGALYKGGCYWAYFQADCNNPLIAYYEPARVDHTFPTDPRTVGPGSSPFQVRPNPAGGCNPCLPATGHSSMNVCMGDGSVRMLAGGMDRLAWWALLTPAGGESVGD